MRVAESYYVEMTYASRPQCLGDDLFSNVKVLRSLMWTASKATAIDE
jgi:hypothetical protein